jgi:hypothetical protein
MERINNDEDVQGKALLNFCSVKFPSNLLVRKFSHFYWTAG